jgi:transposase
MKRRLKYHTPTEIQKHLSEQRNSGQSVDTYCAKAKVAVSTFWNWRKKYRDSYQSPAAVPFLRLPTASASGTPLFEIVFANTTRLKVSSGFDPDTLKTLIAALR